MVMAHTQPAFARLVRRRQSEMRCVWKAQISARAVNRAYLTCEAVVGLERAPEVGQPQRLAHVATVFGRRHFRLRSTDARNV